MSRAAYCFNSHVMFGVQALACGLHGASSQGECVAATIRERNLEKVRQLLYESTELLHAGDARSNLPIHWAVMTRRLDAIDERLSRTCAEGGRRSARSPGAARGCEIRRHVERLDTERQWRAQVPLSTASLLAVSIAQRRHQQPRL